MKNKITLAVLLAAGNMVAQGQAVTKVYYNSDWKVIKATDTVAFYRIVKLDANNKALDTIRDYYASGELNSKTDGALLIDTLNDKNSKYTGTCMEYYKSGKKKSKTVRDAQGNILLSQGWYDNGDFRFTVPYTDGKKEGTGKWYYSGGNLLSEIPYTNDKRNGTGKWYYKEHGTLYSEVKYVDDLKNGVSKYYYESGELDDETTYSNDTIVGVSKYYYKDGKLQSELPHNKGKLEGTYKSYFENGKPMSTYDYANGSLNGYVILYWGNGKLKRRDKYENGKFVEGRCYDSTGAAIEHFDYYVAGPSEDVFTTVQQMPVFPGNIKE
jgi:antitoxin component YwqK of YwqJK toxin-antitoxin module